MTKLQEIEKLSPCKIEYVDSYELLFNTMGGYYWSRILVDYIPHIKIDKNITEIYQSYCVIHEIGHALCHKNNCKCWELTDRSLTEYHAAKFTLKYFLKNKEKEILTATIENINSWEIVIGEHQKAAKRIKKLKLWKKCLEFVNAKGSK